MSIFFVNLLYFQKIRKIQFLHIHKFTLLERVMEEVECDPHGEEISIHGTEIRDLRFADDVDLAETEYALCLTVSQQKREQQYLYLTLTNSNML